MKKVILTAVAILAAATLSARPGPRGPVGFGRGPAPMHHHHHRHHHGGAITADIVGGALLGGLVTAAIAAPRTTTIVTPAPVVVQPAPVVVQQPVVVQPAYQPVYQTQNVWVEGRYVDSVQPNGTVVRTWQPGHYEQRTVQIQ